MNTNPTHDRADHLHGNLLRLSARREIAIYLRDGTAWVADFRDGHGEVCPAGAWFALNQDRWALRRAARDAITPLSADMVRRIENLHRQMEQPRVRPARPQTLALLADGLRVRLARLFGPRPAYPAT
jgi:hypothetical protein